MDIRAATIAAAEHNLWIRKRDRSNEWTLFVAAGGVYRKEDGTDVELDAKDCMGDDRYLIDEFGFIVGGEIVPNAQGEPGLTK